MISLDPELEAVARADIPDRYVRVIGVSIAPSGRYAVVMLTTNEGDALEFDETIAERVGDRWVGLMSSGGPSSVIDVGDHRAAVLCNYTVPLAPDVESVIVRDRGHEHEVPVENGYFLYAAWAQDPGRTPSDPPQPELVRTITRGDPRVAPTES